MKKVRAEKRGVKAAPVKDWLAHIPILAGGTWARGEDRADTIRLCLKMAKSDWSSLVDFAGLEVAVFVGDVTGYDEVHFDSTGIFTIPEGGKRGLNPDRIYLPKERVEVVKHVYPGTPKKRIKRIYH